MRFRITGAALAVLAFACALQVQAADNYAVKDASGTMITMKAKEVGGVKAVTHTVAASDGTTLINPATSDKQPSLGTAGTPSSNVLTVQGITSMTALKVDGSAVTQPVSGTFWQTTQPVSAASLPLPTGAATAAKQPALGTAGSAASDVLTVQGIASMTALKVDGSAVTQPVSAASLPLPSGAATETSTAAIGTILGAVTASPAANTIGDRLKTIDATLSGGIDVTCVSGCSGGGGSGYSVLNASTYANSSSYSNVPSGGLVSTSAPTYTNGQASPLSLTTAGDLRVSVGGTVPVSGTFWQTTQPVSAASLPLPSGASTAAKQPALGTAGTASSDVLTVQGIASMTALKVDGSAVTQPVSAASLPLPTGAGTAANQATLIGHVDGVEASLTAIAGYVDGLEATTAAPSVAQDTAGAVKIVQASESAPITMSTATTTQFVALSSGKKIYVTALDVIAAGTTNVTFKYGTGTNCGTGTTSLTGAYPLTAQAGLAKGSGLGPVLVVPVGNALCVTSSAAVQVSGSVAYAQF